MFEVYRKDHHGTYQPVMSQLLNSVKIRLPKSNQML